MAVKISELTASAPLTSDDILPVVDSGSMTTKKASAQQVLNYITGSTFNNLTVTNITGTTAQFTTLTASNTTIAGDLVLSGTANLSNYPDYAYIIYTSSYDKLVVFPGLYVSGNLTGSGNASFGELTGNVAFSASYPSHWSGSPPTNLQEAINRIAAAVFSGSSGAIA